MIAQPRYWMDANVIIEAQRRTYPIGLTPSESFWNWLAAKVEAGRIVCTKMVYLEVAENQGHQDRLAKWFQVRREMGLCIKPSQQVQARVGAITTQIFSSHRYPQHHAMKFARGADPWLIAHAWDDSGVVVTQESDLKPEAHVVRIPDVCDTFNIRCINLLGMMQELS